MLGNLTCPFLALQEQPRFGAGIRLAGFFFLTRNCVMKTNGTIPAGLPAEPA